MFVHTPPDLYGASRSLLRLCGRLQADGHEVTAVLAERGMLAERLEQAGVAVATDPELVYLNGARWNRSGLLRLAASLPRSAARIVRLIRQKRADVVHTNTALILSGALGAALARRPHLWHVREHFDGYPRLWRLYQYVLTGLAHRVVAVSESVAAQFHRTLRNRRVTVIHNGFSASEFVAPEPTRVAAFRRRFGLEGASLVGLVGRIRLRRKGQEVLVEAAARLRDRHPRARFVLIGSPFPGNEAHERQLRAMIAARNLEDRVVLAGEMEDIPAAYAALDIVTLCSTLPEAFSGVVVEAMAMGKPVVGTAIGGTPEQIEDGVTGLLVPPGDPEALAHALDRLLSDPELRLQMGQAGRRRFLEHFEFEPFYRRMLALYEEVLRPRVPSRVPVHAESVH
jgi:glycosyltransferase involved in cell wall biosynthesis